MSSARNADPQRIRTVMEASLLRSVERELHERNIIFRKRWGGLGATAGDPDLYFVVGGLHCEVELKRIGCSPTVLQQARLRAWEAAGAKCAVVHTLQDLRNFLDLVATFNRCK